MLLFIVLHLFTHPSMAETRYLTENVFNSGIEFGGVYSDPIVFNSMLSLRFSLVQHIEPKNVVRLTDALSIKANQKEQPWRWRGVYLRWERLNDQDRFVAGYGGSLFYTGIGYELGAIGLPNFDTQKVEYGAEIGGVLTVGVFGFYIRENVFFANQLKWETQTGVRLMIPLSLIFK